MPGKSGAPALRRVTRLSRSSCLTDLLVYPLARSSPTVLGLVTRTLCREVCGLSIAVASRRQQVAEEEHAELDEEELVPRRHCGERLARVGDLVGERALGQAHGAHHELRGNLAARPVLAVAVGEGHGEAVVHEAVRDGHFCRLAEPAAETVTAPLDTRAIRRAVLGEEELRGVGELEEVLVEGGGERGLVLENERRGAPDELHVFLVQTHEGHLLPHEALHVCAGMRALGPRHRLSSPCDNSLPWRAYPQPWARACALS